MADPGVVLFASAVTLAAALRAGLLTGKALRAAAGDLWAGRWVS
jgi:hypothetical protein